MTVESENDFWYLLYTKFSHPIRNFVFMPLTAVFQEKFHAWYQTKVYDMVYHLRRAEACVATPSHKKSTKLRSRMFLALSKEMVKFGKKFVLFS